MKRMICGLVVALMILPGISFAQSTTQTAPTPPASWTTFLQQENAKRAAFFKQMKEDRDAFLKSNPDAQAYLDKMRTLAQARAQAWRAAHPRKTTPGTATTSN